MSARNLIVGIDFNRSQPQICYYEKENENTVIAPMKVGNDQVSFEDIFDELDQLESEADAEAAKKKEKMNRLIGNASETFRRALATLGLDDPERQISGIVITVPKLRTEEVELIRGIYRSLGLDKIRAHLQDYKESFYYHTLYRDKDIWNRDVGFFRFQGRKITFSYLEGNSKTRPMTFRYVDGAGLELEGEKETWDEQFCTLIESSLGRSVFSSVIVTGDTYDQSWAKRSTAQLLKNGRRAFIQDNLYAKGACCAAREKAVEKKLGNYLYLGEDLVCTNIGMEMIIQGKETYYPLLPAGVNWYEAHKTFECILTGDRPELKFLLSGLRDKKQRLSVIPLPGLDLKSRPEGTMRLGIRLAYKNAGCCVVDVEDLGFGELYPSTGEKWRGELSC
uniref:DUF5716 family protein n=1 Tax=Eubacterium cellulosolvens TaxID=29322 RepID=UPI000488FA88|nr:DUF5716 family protein [[Eubacterium] cellulosolvens]